ncbi:hypothetical protein B0H16DRAFT_1686706 [Mycena metata]|uniref:Secreted protein n=1 Tax=Mycena metata TaxID=1033252 RepID=A0AAD7JM11_9AGAR|nr:hypothetical protein B0H16DRAFT_1686706 [Mycena metata]
MIRAVVRFFLLPAIFSVVLWSASKMDGRWFTGTAAASLCELGRIPEVVHVIGGNISWCFRVRSAIIKRTRLGESIEAEVYGTPPASLSPAQANSQTRRTGFDSPRPDWRTSKAFFVASRGVTFARCKTTDSSLLTGKTRAAPAQFAEYMAPSLPHSSAHSASPNCPQTSQIGRGVREARCMSLNLVASTHRRGSTPRVRIKKHCDAFASLSFEYTSSNLLNSQATPVQEKQPTKQPPRLLPEFPTHVTGNKGSRNKGSESDVVNVETHTTGKSGFNVQLPASELHRTGRAHLLYTQYRCIQRGLIVEPSLAIAWKELLVY